jgi:hypothetical protein
VPVLEPRGSEGLPGKPGTRLRAHINEAINASVGTPKNRWLLALRAVGLSAQIEIIESGSGESWRVAERRWIAYHRATGARLVNIMDGGQVIWGTPEYLSAIGKNRWAAATLAR